MFDGNNGKNSCALGEERLLSYIYGEMSEGERAAFKQHITGCVDCSAEASSFGNVRSDINDWFSTEFAAFEPLNVVIPELTAAKTENIPLWQRLFGSFAGLKFALGGAMALLVVAGLFFGLKFGNNSNETVVALNVSETPKSSPSVTPTATKQPVVAEVAENTPEAAPTVEAVKTSVSSPRRNVQPRPAYQAVPASNPVKPVQKRRDTKAAPTANQKASPVKSVVLDSEEDSEDDSLRLFDIFSEIGSD